MAADREKVAIQSPEFPDFFAERLCRVDMEKSVRLGNQRGDFQHGLKDARLVIRVHDRDQQECRTSAGFEPHLDRHTPAGNRQILDIKTLPGEDAQGAEDGSVLDRGGQDVHSTSSSAMARPARARRGYCSRLLRS